MEVDDRIRRNWEASERDHLCAYTTVWGANYVRRCPNYLSWEVQHVGGHTCRDHWIVEPDVPPLIEGLRQRREVQRAYKAFRVLMEEYQPYPPMRVESIEGIDKLFGAIFGKKKDGRSNVHWSEGPVARFEPLPRVVVQRVG